MQQQQQQRRVQAGMEPAACFFREYRGVIALNNAGVSLLEKRCYRQAMDTLQDTVFCMKLAFHCNSSTKQQQTYCSSSSNDIQSKLQRAMRRLADPRPDSEALSSPAHHVHSLDTFSWEDQRPIFDRILQEGPSCNPTVYPIRIETENVSRSSLMIDEDEQFFVLESAVSLYNYGLAHICLSRTALPTSKISELQKEALELLEFSHGLLLQRYERCEDDDEAHRLLTTAILVCICLLQTLRDSNNMQEGRPFYENLIDLRRILYQISVGSEQHHTTLAGGAAAA